MISKIVLEDLYFQKKLSMLEISKKLDCSVNKVSYWMKYHNLRRRSISEGVYVKNNPLGDPFTFRQPITKEEYQLFGLGLGLYWGEGTKANHYSVRLGNTDPKNDQYIHMFFRKILFYSTKRFEVRCSGV